MKGSRGGASRRLSSGDVAKAGIMKLPAPLRTLRRRLGPDTARPFGLHRMLIRTEVNNGGEALLRTLKSVATQVYPKSLFEHEVCLPGPRADSVVELCIEDFQKSYPEARIRLRLDSEALDKSSVESLSSVPLDAGRYLPVWSKGGRSSVPLRLDAGRIVIELEEGATFPHPRYLEEYNYWAARSTPRRPASPPLVSVLVPAYNEEQYIRAAMDSLLTQTHLELNIIVINDGSTDRTPDILEEMAKGESRLRIVHQENQGIIGALNQALSLAEGDFIARMDANDISAKERIELQLEYLHRFPDVGLVSTWQAAVDPNGLPTGAIWRTPVLAQEVAWALHFATSLVHPALLGRRAVFEDLGGYRREGVEHIEDYDLFARLLGTVKMANLPEVLHFRRELSSSITHQQAEAQAQGVQRVMQRVWSERLGRKLGSDEAEALFRTHRSQPVEGAAIMGARHNLFQLYARFTDEFELSALEQERVAFDLARKLSFLTNCALRNGQVFQGAEMLAQASFLSPIEFPARAAQAMARRVISWPRSFV